MSTSSDKSEQTAAVVVGSTTGDDRQEYINKGDSETAAAATTLTSFLSDDKTKNKKSPPAENEDGRAVNEFEIPQRFTKSGRKRAVPFPMKVRRRNYPLQKLCFLVVCRKSCSHNKTVCMYVCVCICS